MLDPLDMNILSMKLAGVSVTEIAKRMGVSRTTVHARMKRDEFIAAYDEVITAAKDATRERCIQATEAAYDALCHTLTHPLGVRTSDTLKAAEIALKHLKRDE